MSQNTGALPPQSVAMATPIQTLSPQGQGQGVGITSGGANPTDLSDPLVSDVLNEMEKEVNQARQQSSALHSQGHGMNGLSASIASMPSAPTLASMPFPGTSLKNTASSVQWIHVSHLKVAVICMVFSYIIFNPSGILPSLYYRFSKLNFLESYDLFVRIFLLGVFLYVLLTYVPLP